MERLDQQDADEAFMDRQLGDFLLSSRMTHGLRVGEVSKLTGIRIERILELESGKPDKGITKTEAKLFSAIYRVSPSEMLSKVLKEIH